MCGSCDSILCPAVPEIDWSAFAWRWQSPASAVEWIHNATINGTTQTVGRRFAETDREMAHPGVCNCLWLVAVSDQARIVADGQVYGSVPAIGSLQCSGQTWLLTLVRWYTNWNLEAGFWGWDDTWTPNECSPLNGGAAGWSPFGWNGWGWGYGWNYGWYAYNGAYANRAEYVLNGSKLLTDGSINEFLPLRLVTNGPDAGDTAGNQYWPAFVNLSTIPKDGRQF